MNKPKRLRPLAHSAEPDALVPADASRRLHGHPGGPGRSPVVTILVTAVNPRGRKCVCRRLVWQRGRRILRPVLLPDRGC
jgi:hypothetical protein